MAIMAAVCLAGCVQNKPIYQADPHGPPRELTASEKQAVAATISKGLKDPSAAIFYWTPANTPTGPSGVVAYCGMINGKNSYGGYIGASPYLASLIYRDGVAVGAALVDIASDTTTSSAATLLMCRENGYDPFSAK